MPRGGRHLVQVAALLNGPDGADLLGAEGGNTTGPALLKALPGALQGLPARVDQLANQINVAVRGRPRPPPPPPPRLAAPLLASDRQTTPIWVAASSCGVGASIA